MEFPKFIADLPPGLRILIIALLAVLAHFMVRGVIGGRPSVIQWFRKSTSLIMSSAARVATSAWDGSGMGKPQ